jgi:hypothetical protein
MTGRRRERGEQESLRQGGDDVHGGELVLRVMVIDGIDCKYWSSMGMISMAVNKCKER